MKTPVFLTEDLYICGGTHKKVFIHPQADDLCIKIPHTTNDIDLKRELTYRKILSLKQDDKEMLPKYYGTIQTNLGKGFVFERIKDYDNSTSQDFEAFIKTIPPTQDGLLFLKKVLQSFKKLYFQQNIVTSDIDPGNMVLQKTSPTSFTIKIVDNIGSPVLIPLEYISNYFLRRKTQRYYARFLRNLSRKFPEIFTPDFINDIK